MNNPIRHLARLAAASLLVIAGAAGADDVEIFQGVPNTVSSVRPNILFIFDTSGSMDTQVVTQTTYDPATTYSGSCSSSNIYYVEGNSVPPAKVSDICDKTYVTAAQFRCNAAMSALNASGSYLAVGIGLWNAKDTWKEFKSSNKPAEYVECKADAGIHGDGVDTSKLYAADGKTTGPWTSDPAQRLSWTANKTDKTVTLYSANYLNWYYGNKTITSTRIKIMQDVAKSVLTQLAVSDNVNVGLMRFDRLAEGGMVLREVKPVAANVGAMRTDIDGLSASGNTPLSETMYEAYLYLSGAKVRFGLTSYDAYGPRPSVSTSRVTGNQSMYQSPLQTSCQKNFIVLLTDGEPTADNSADTEIEALRGRRCAGNGAGRCLEEIAEYMYQNDLRSQLTGVQNVTTYTIGFGDDVAGSKALKDTAKQGGGTFFVAGDTATLSTVLTTIVRSILAYNTSFTAPAVSVNAFNRTQNLNDLYITVFKPDSVYAWLGNVKKYKLSADGTIRDANGAPAVNIATGFFNDTAQSFWSPMVDGQVAKDGGAASQLPAPAARKVYSNLNPVDPNTLTSSLNTVATSNALITTTTLGLGLTEAPGRDALINWLRGADIDDNNGDGSTIDARLTIGDPMHGRPATVVYGGTAASPDATDSVIYAVTNDGYLHAINTKTGGELWAFIPQQMLARARDLYYNPAVNARNYGLDGNIRVNQIDVNGNGVMEPLLGDRVIIYFGMRRGGSNYYALDVSDRNAPKFLWRIGPNEVGLKQLPNAGQSWSTPTLARVTVGGATQNSLKQVLVIGGGYDPVQDNGPYATDTSGNRIYMVDAVSGDLLWYAGPSTDTVADLKLASMTHSIPADVRVVDLTGDGFADRMYAVDMGGRVWRFDIDNGKTRSALVTGGVFASLGNAHLGTHPDATTRRFYNAPDVAYLSNGGRTWLNIAVGSGYRGHPLNVNTQERFYALRDHQPLARLTQTQYSTATPIYESDLVDVTSDMAPVIAPGAKGWRLDLRRATGSWSGEKSLAEARTVQNYIQFTTYEPNSVSTTQSTSCAPGVGVNRLYTVSAFTGSPVFNRDNPESPPDSIEDRDTELAQGGIAPEVVWVFPPPDNPSTCVGAECRPPPVCLIGLESCGVGVELAPVRTFWRQNGVD